MSKKIFAAEITFEDAPGFVRDTFHGSEMNVRKILRRLMPAVEEVYALGTASRFTLYIVHENIFPLTSFFHVDHSMKGYVQFYYNTDESVTHFFATAAGLLSEVKGDNVVLEDIRRSFGWATDTGCIGVMLDNLLRRSLDTGRRVRTLAGIDKFGVSLIDTAMELLYQRFENLHTKNFLVLGSGTMAEGTLEYLCREGIRNIVVADHCRAHAMQLSEKYKVKWVSIEQAGSLLAYSDVIIGAAHREVVFEQKYATVQAIEHPGRFMIDFGSPRNFDPRLGDMFQAELYALDDLRRQEPSTLDSFGGLDLAWKLVMKEANEFIDMLSRLHHAPVLAAILKRQLSPGRNILPAKARITLRSLLFLKRAESPAGTVIHQVQNLLNNCRADNPRDVVRHLSAFRKYSLSDN